MKLVEWAKKQGIHYRTALRWFHSGTMPVPARRVSRKLILVDEPVRESGTVALYARVSSSGQKADLDRQIARLTQFAVARGLAVSHITTEIGSGRNGRRIKLRKLLADGNIKTVVVEHRDRLTRFGFDFIESALAAQDRSVLVVDDGEVADDLVRDMTEVLTSFCARLYGKRGAKNRAQRVIATLEQTQ